jgi:hypothetical protein
VNRLPNPGKLVEEVEVVRIVEWDIVVRRQTVVPINWTVKPQQLSSLRIKCTFDVDFAKVSDFFNGDVGDKGRRGVEFPGRYQPPATFQRAPNELFR